MARIRSRCSALTSSGTITLARIVGFNDYGCPVRKHLSHSRGQFGGVIASADYGVRADLRSVLNHDFEGILARLLTKLGPNGYIAAHNRLQRSAQGREDISRANHYAADYAKILYDAIIR